MKIRPYGDTLHDGKIQLSFTLPIPCSLHGEETAKALVKKMGIHDVHVVHATPLNDNYSFYILYGTTHHEIDPSTVSVTDVDTDTLTKSDIEDYIEQHFNRPLIFIGASTGTDAHTVGIDAIMNMKGYAGHYGLERYKGIKAINLGSQIDNETLLEEAVKHQADVILISQTVTQKDVHIQNLTAFIELLEAENKRDDFIVIIGGPRITHSLAKELGYDAGFGPKKYAFDVASFAVQALNIKLNKEV